MKKVLQTIREFFKPYGAIGLNVFEHSAPGQTTYTWR